MPQRAQPHRAHLHGCQGSHGVAGAIGERIGCPAIVPQHGERVRFD